MPERGRIGIFNRSHYEEVLVVRVHPEILEGQNIPDKLTGNDVWKTRFKDIRAFERHLANNGTVVLKFFLHISKEEQRERLQARLDVPHKRWKFSKGDLAERKLWDDYQAAYADAINKCNTTYAPWHVVCADRKWHRNLVISSIVRSTLEKMGPQFPPAEKGLEGIVVE